MEGAAFFPSSAKATELPPSYVHSNGECPSVAYNNFSTEVPVISLAGIDDNGPQRERIGEEVVRACEDWGVFQVVDHGVDLELVSLLQKLGRDFFSLPSEDKMLLDMSGGKKGGFSISSPFKGDSVQNWREMFTFFSYPVEDRDYSRWPEKPDGFRSAVECYSNKLMELAHKLLGILSEAMGLERDALADACVNMDQKVIVNYYPECPQPDRTLGLRRHTDPGTITILLQDEVGGLQATKDDGKTWITVKPVEGAFVVNLGDHGYFLSNGRFLAADHQAVVNSERSRLSIATFQYPSQEAMVYPLAVREGERAIIEPMTFAEMFRRKISHDVEASNMKKQGKIKEEKKMEDVVAAAKANPTEGVFV